MEYGVVVAGVDRHDTGEDGGGGGGGGRGGGGGGGEGGGGGRGGGGGGGRGTGAERSHKRLGSISKADGCYGQKTPEKKEAHCWRKEVMPS